MRADKTGKVVSVILLAVVVGNAEAAQSNVLTGIQNMVQSSSSGWMSAALGLAQGLFVGLAGIEIAWTGIHWVLKKNDLSDFIASFALKMISILFFYMLLQEAPVWIPMIINSFAQAGQTVGASGGGGIPVVALDPSSVFEQGMTVSGAIWSSFQNASSTMGIGQTVAGAFATLSGSLFSIVAYGLLALQILITNIESYIIIGGGALLLGFNGSKWTQVFAEKYLGYAVSVGIKLFVLYLIVGLGQNLANTWVTRLGSLHAGNSHTGWGRCPDIRGYGDHGSWYCRIDTQWFAQHVPWKYGWSRSRCCCRDGWGSHGRCRACDRRSQQPGKTGRYGEQWRERYATWNRGWWD